MGPRSLFAAAATAALVVPALALAEGIGPHATGYEQHPGSTKPQNDVSIIVHRDTSTADLFVNNFCLGSSSGGSTKYPDSVSERGVKVSHHKIAFHGKATKYTAEGQEQLAMRFAATVGRKRVKGTVKFPGTSCGTIHFKAKRTQRTK
jgi:hypothetical protein